jgi:DNA-binding SARP family transcriptional activator
MLDSNDYHVLYYALGPDDISVESVVSGMTHDLPNQRTLFGRHLNMLDMQGQSNLSDLIQAFSREMADMQDRPVLLVLDEYDRSDSADDVQYFVEQLSQHLPDHVRIVINSRTMPRLPWVSMIAQRRALLLRDGEVIRREFYGAIPQTDYDLEVFGLGPGFVLLNGQLIDSWEGHLPRLLFFFALDKPVVTRSEICRAFWPDLDLEQAVNVFHVTKRRLHKALGFEADVLLHEDGYYRVNPEISSDYDVMHFVTALMDARADAHNRPFEKWQRVVNLYRGPYLHGHDDSWILERRRDYRAGYVEALTQMADIREADDRLEHALSFVLQAAEEDILREDLHQRVMELYARLGRRSEVAGYYRRIVDAASRRKQPLSDETHAAYQGIIA